MSAKIAWGGDCVMKSAAVACAAFSVLAAIGGPAWSADPAVRVQMPPPAQMREYVPPPLWFVEGRAGGSWGWLNDLKFLNPDGTVFTLSPTDGNFILLSNKSPADTSWTAGASVGYFVSSQFFVTLTYQYFGKFQASGFALFPAGNFRQDLKTTAQGLLVGLGWDVKTGGTIFIEPTIAVGAGFLDSTGSQGANLGIPNAFPSRSHVNFIAGGGLGIGSHVNRNLDVIVSGNYTWLGNADTGITGFPPPGGMNTGEQLQARLGVFTLTGGGRVKF